MKGIGTDWAAFSGDIFIGDEITVGGFRASGFSVRVWPFTMYQMGSISTKPQDYLVFTMTPPDPSKSPFKELRMVIPVRLATDRWNDDGAGLSAYGPPSISSSEELAAAPELPYIA